MIGVTILDRDPSGLLAPTLIDLLTLLRPFAASLTWVASDVEAVGNGAAALHDAANRSIRLTLDELLQLAKSIEQVIDGEFAGYNVEEQKQLVIRVVDSTAFDVETHDASIAALVEAKFLQSRRYDG